MLIIHSIEFYESIDLSEFLETPPATPARYMLHSVLVHSGECCSGSQRGHVACVGSMALLSLILFIIIIHAFFTTFRSQRLPLSLWPYPPPLIHALAGGASGGHYIVFIRPKLGGPWYKFDDDWVTVASKEDAMDKNFGSSDKVSACGLVRYSFSFGFVAHAIDLL